jgi:hypothetical protein
MVAMAGRSNYVRYDIDGGDMLAYGFIPAFSLAARFFRHIDNPRRSWPPSSRPVSLPEVERTY